MSRCYAWPIQLMAAIRSAGQADMSLQWSWWSYNTCGGGREGRVHGCQRPSLAGAVRQKMLAGVRGGAEGA